MIWKNLVLWMALAWLTVSQAGQQVVKEDLTDTLQHKYESPYAQKAPQRGVAQQGKPPIENSKEEAPPMKYWRWTDDSQAPKD